MLISHEETYYPNLPIPPVQFWQAWLVIRNYLLMYHHQDLFGKFNFQTFIRDGVEFKQRYDLLTAFWIMDYYYDRFLTAEESRGIAK